MPRPVWFLINGQRLTLGSGELTSIYRVTRVTATPYKPVDVYTVYFSMLEDQIKARGYEIRIYEGGKITVDLPISDKYGWVFREIARTYYLAQKTEAR